MPSRIRMFSRQSRIFFVLLSALLLAPGYLQAAVSVDGTLTIPQPAPVGGVQIDLFLEDTESYSWTEITVAIPEGESSAGYALSNT